MAAGASRSISRHDKKATNAFRTISEVADELDIQQHVLRFWETKFSQVRPLKRGGGRRYYRPEDISLLKAIHYLLYTEGYTIKGVQKLLREVGKKKIVNLVEVALREQNGEAPIPSTPTTKTETIDDPDMPDSAVAQKLSPEQRAALQDVLQELKELREIIKR
ncbi:MAG: MerR family transcriptional regulator [Alphaproteobacteria bacterium]|nr:MerR family transcriptional regulator [Alphaproteobacteria bacterium]